MANEKNEDDGRVSLALAEPPADPAAAKNYRELYELLQVLHNSIAGTNTKMSNDEFIAWDEKAHSLLAPAEIARLEKPLRPHIPNETDTIQYARHFHLTKILWARKGIEKLMQDTGY